VQKHAILLSWSAAWTNSCTVLLFIVNITGICRVARNAGN
jgi:hypothetical protein